MPVDVFEGGCGHIVIGQEFPNLMQGDCYLRVFIKPEDAEKVQCKSWRLLKRRVANEPLVSLLR
jgi:hypothetical protein